MKNISIKGSSGKPILLDVFFSKKPISPLVIFSHGFKGFKDWGAFNLVAETFSNEGLSFLKFNFSYNGISSSDLLKFSDLESFGNNNFSIEMNDLGLVVDWVEQNLFDKIDLNQIFLLGHSRGGGVSILKASEDKRIKKIVSWASVSDFENRFPKEKRDIWKARGVAYVYNNRTNQQMPIYYQFLEDFYKYKDRFDIPKAVKSLSIPLLIIHGEEDLTVNVSDAYKLHKNALNSELYIVKGADHVFNIKHPLLKKILSKELKIVVNKTISFFKI